jgi:hypothetical protein
MTKPKLTPWFPGTVKPARAGVYMQMSGGSLPITGYQRWDGGRWFGWCYTPDAAALEPAVAHQRSQNDRWRGLARDPGAKS